MNKKLTISTLIFLTLGLVIIALVIFIDREPAPEPFLCNGQPCNVILIIPETLSARHMGIYGYERDTTPFIDEFFSEESLIFENAWSGSSWTVPSFAALFTSQLPSEVFVERREDKLSRKIPTFVDILGENKITKFAIHTITLSYVFNEGIITRFAPGEHSLTISLNDNFQFLQAAQWIEDRRQKDSTRPFFLLLQPFAPHDPYHPPKPYRYFFDAPSEYPGAVTSIEINEVASALQWGEETEEKIDRFCLQYDQEIRYLDSEIETFISRLPEEIIQSTVFIFTSDHGEAFGQHGFLAHIASPYEEVIHIPFLVKVPGIEARRIKEPITLLDAGPTILDIFGLEMPETFTGISLLPAFIGSDLEKSRIIKTEYRIYTHPTASEVLQGISSEVRTKPLSGPKEKAVRKESWKLLKRADDSLELYNLERDYNEQDNLIPRWHDLSPEDRIEIIPLFEAVGKSPPL